MEQSILIDVKKHLGLDGDYECFDPDIIIGINSAFMNLADLGVGPSTPFRIDGPNENWSDFLEDSPLLGFVQEYVPLRTRIIFDPPTSSFVLDAIQKRIDELEWRMNVSAEQMEGDLDG